MDRPEATFEGLGEAPVTVELSRFKEDYKRTQRNGQNVYALTANPTQFITGDEFKMLTTRKEAEKEAKRQLGGSGGKVLSKAEVEELYEPLLAALSDEFEILDKILWKLAPHIDERPIWSNTTEREDAVLTRTLLRRGQKSPATAAVVRTMVDAGDYVAVGVAFAPRFVESVQVVREARQLASGQERKPFSFFRKVEKA